FLARGDVHETTARKTSAIFRWPEDARQVMQAGRREGEAIVRAIEARAVRDRRHFDCGFGAVGERVVHLRVEVALGHFFLGPAEEAPYRVRCRIAIARLEIHALA